MNFRSLSWELYEYREVLWNLLGRDLKVKYKRTILGYFWSLLNPLLQLVVLTLVFSHFVKWNMKDYSLYLFSGIIAWTFFQQSLTLGSIAIIENENFIKKIYLPKILFPLSKVCMRGIDCLFALVALLILGAFFGFPMHATLLLLPLALGVLFVFTLGFVIILSVATVYFRDLEYLTGVLLQLVYFATPILYPMDALPKAYLPWLQLNPMYSQVHIFHQLIYFGTLPSSMDWMLAVGGAMLSLVAGLIILILFDQDIVFRM